MHAFDDLVHTIDKLRSEHGCPWGKEQTHESLKVCLADESQEIYDAIDNRDMENLCEELGGILLQMMLHSQIAKEEGAFTIDGVVDGVCRKIIRKHPHVFGDVKVNSIGEGSALRNAVKERKKTEKPQQSMEKRL